MHGDPLHLAVLDLALTTVKSSPDVDTYRAYLSTDAHSAADRPPGSVKRSQEAISGYIYLVAAEPGQLSPHDGVVLREQLAPIPISPLYRSFRRANNVGKEGRSQEAHRVRARAGAGEKF